MTNDLSELQKRALAIVEIYSTLNRITDREADILHRAITMDRPKGEWEDMSWFYHKPMYKCTRCNQILEIGYYSYCPYCGAYMRGEENE